MGDCYRAELAHKELSGSKNDILLTGCNRNRHIDGYQRLILSFYSILSILVPQQIGFLLMITNMTEYTNRKRWSLPVLVILFVAPVLIGLEISSPRMLIAERFMRGAGWLQMILVLVYAGFLAFHMQDPEKAPKWRGISWSIFSIVFFLQLLLGLLVSDKFLLSGELHLPVPAMILAGPFHRAELSFMTFLFLSTVALTGPAWCSQLCYFGAFDHWAARSKTSGRSVAFSAPLRWTTLAVTISVALVLRLLGASSLISTTLAALFGLIGLAVMLIFSRNRKTMVHCTVYCPIGTLVHLLKKINPFRLRISPHCTRCMRCLSHCRYDALHREDILNGTPGHTCTLCGDCLAGCPHNAIAYKFFRLSAQNARFLWLFLTISLHALFLAIARI